MSKSIAQTGTGKYESASTSTTALAAFGSTTTAGNSIYVLVYGHLSSSTGFGITSISDTAGNTYAEVIKGPANGSGTGRAHAIIWAAHNISAQASNVVTITWNSSAAKYMHAQAIEVSATGGVQSADQNSGTSGTVGSGVGSVTATCTSANTDAAAIAFAVGGQFVTGGADRTVSLPSGYTSTYLYTDTDDFRPAARFCYKILSGAETTSVTFTVDDTNGGMSAACATFQEPSVTKYLKLLASASAQSDTGVSGVVFDGTGYTTSDYLGTFSGKSFEASLESGSAVLKVPVADFGGSALTTSSTPSAFIWNSSDAGIGPADCTVIEE